MGSYKAGAFSQSCYRFNTYIGMAVVINLFGEKGVQLFAILVGLLIPLINVMSVGVLVWNDDTAKSSSSRPAATIRILLTNPLILGCLAGMVYAFYIGGFPLYIDNFLRLLSSTTLPLALFSIGGALSLKGVQDNIFPAALGAMTKLVLLPLAGWCFLRLLHVQGLSWQVCMLFFFLTYFHCNICVVGTVTFRHGAGLRRHSAFHYLRFFHHVCRNSLYHLTRISYPTVQGLLRCQDDFTAFSVHHNPFMCAAGLSKGNCFRYDRFQGAGLQGCLNPGLGLAHFLIRAVE